MINFCVPYDTEENKLDNIARSDTVLMVPLTPMPAALATAQGPL